MSALVMYAIYAHPKDYPESFVIRRWFCFPGEEEPRAEIHPYCWELTLDAVRKHLPPGLTVLPRFENDDPKIVEVWL